MATVDEYRAAAGKVMQMPEFQARADGILAGLLERANLSEQSVAAVQIASAVSLSVYWQAQLCRQHGWCAPYTVQAQTIRVCLEASKAIQEMGWNMIQEQLKEDSDGQAEAAD